jgi:hypothetical protein
MNAVPVLHKVKQLYRDHGMPVNNVNVFGLRDSSKWEKDIFNDYIGVWSGDELLIYAATTDPGKYYTTNPMNRKGTAHLVLGNHIGIWMIGSHKNEYEALVQWGNEVTVWRDRNKNNVKDQGELVESGYFGINCHTDMGVDMFIDYASAGCQVIRDSNSFFNEFMPFVKRNLNQQEKISYLLVDRKELDVTL